MKSSILGFTGFGLLLSLQACDPGGTTGTEGTGGLTFAPGLGVDLTQMTRTSSGLYYQDLVVGTGEEAVEGGRVTVHYTGWLHDGTQFDTSLGGDPATFNLYEVIQGWAEGVPGMKVGGKRKLVVPPHLGYGQAGSPPLIPGNATLVFDIDLLGVG